MIMRDEADATAPDADADGISDIPTSDAAYAALSRLPTAAENRASNPLYRQPPPGCVASSLPEIVSQFAC